MTIREIAKAAGVSPATVSLVLNNKPGVSEERRQLIKDLLNEIGYSKKPSPKTTTSILLLKYIRYGTIVEHNGDFVTRVLDGLQAEVDRLKIHLTTRNVSSTNTHEAFECFSSGSYDGCIVLGTELDEEFAVQLEQSPIPIVVLDNLVEHCHLDSVAIDNRGGAYKAVEYLISCGHKKIGYIKSRFDIANFRQRYEGFVQALQKHGIPLVPDYIFEVEPTMHGAYHDMLQYLSQGHELPTAMFAGNDSMGAGVVKALKQYSCRVPGQVSVIGMDDLPFCTILDPMLTTMAIPKETMGRLAVQRVFEKIQHPDTERLRQMVCPQLIERESVLKRNK